MKEKEHVCPVWVGYLMTSSLRKLHQNPQKILSPFVNEGMNILELGPALGFFSIPLAQMTGQTGKVYCVDIQKNMLDKLEKRAEKYKVRNQVELIQSTKESFNIGHLKNTIDFAFLFYVIHELPDQEKFFKELSVTMKHGSKVLFAEPKGHVTQPGFENSIQIAEKEGFVKTRQIKIAGSRAIVLKKSHV